MLKFPSDTTLVNSDLLYSFDIFDTLLTRAVLTRAVGSRKAVFLLLGNYLAANNFIDCSPEVFARLRIQAQNAAFNKPDRSEVTLSQIYTELQDMIDISSEKAAEIMKLECEVEGYLLIDIPGAEEKIAKVSNAGHSFKKEQLNKNEFIVEDNNCYVTSSHSKTNRSGALFKHVAEDCGVQLKNFTHHGDNKKSDFDAPTKLKWNAVHNKDSKINRFEDVMNDFMWDTGGLSSAMAGASRLARLSIKPDNAAHSEIIKITAGVAAPVLVAFILWVLRRAQKKGLKRLYFVSRDGQIYLKIAEILIRKLYLDIEPRYLYASRNTWNFASVTELDSFIKKIRKKVKGEILTIEMAFSRVSTEPKEIKTHLAEAGFAESYWKKDLTQKEIDKLTKVILKPEVQQLILQKAAEKRKLVYEYVKQEGLTLDDKWALVDIGWGGTSQDFLGKILENNDFPPKGFYLVSRAKEGDKEGFLADRIRNTGYARLMMRGSLSKTSVSTGLIESFCTADHGTVIGYKKEREKIVPVLEALNIEKLKHWDYKTIHKTMCVFAEALFLDKRFLNPYINLKPLTAKLLEVFVRNPTRPEAKAWGRFPLEDNTFETRFLSLAEPYHIKHLWNVFLNGDTSQNSVSWREGAMVISSKSMRILVHYTAKAGRFARRIFTSKAGRLLIRRMEHNRN